MIEYILTQRPPSIGTHPNGTIKDPQEVAYMGRVCWILTYEDELSIDEVKRFELDKVLVKSDIKEYSDKVRIDDICENNSCKVSHLFGGKWVQLNGLYNFKYVISNT